MFPILCACVCVCVRVCVHIVTHPKHTHTLSDLVTTRTQIYHSTEMTEEWQQHNYNTGSTHKTVIELASHIQISSNITTPTRKHADTQHLATRQKARPPLKSHTLQGLYGNTAEHTNSQSTGMLSQTIYTPHCRETSLGII